MPALQSMRTKDSYASPSPQLGNGTLRSRAKMRMLPPLLNRPGVKTGDLILRLDWLAPSKNSSAQLVRIRMAGV